MSKVAGQSVPYVNFWTDGACTANYSDHWVNWQQDLEADCCEGGMIIAPDGIPRNPALCIVWLLFLGWIFMGVALGAEVFMTAIEVVTAKESKKTHTAADGTTSVYHVRVWNATVANLTLMALGSSAPEILLNLFEVVFLENFNSGALGPSTIVGSAAFNLMVITAVCIVCLKPGEKRTLKQLGVFLTTAFYSVLAYIWLYIMVIVWTPDVITVEEGIITCVLLCILIVQAYIVDKRATRIAQQKYVNVSKGGGAKAKGQPTKAEAAAAIKAANLGANASADEIKNALEDELLPPKSKAYYRKQAMAGLAGGKGGAENKVAPAAEVAGDIEPSRAKTAPDSPSDIPDDPEKPGVIRWAEHTVSVMESGGAVTVVVERKGGSKGAVSCSYATKNQKATAGKDYEQVDGTLEWEDGDVSKKKIEIKIYDDDEFEKDEDFTVVLVDPKGGATFPRETDGGEEEEICTVTIVNDDDRASRLVEAIRLLRLDADSLDLAGDDWKAALKDAIIPPKGAGVQDLIMHALMVPWKLMFALCPPAGLCGGWPCFFISLLLIGFQVILISDFANQAGCQMYIKPSVTAITIVALGTSLPDTFASMQAARGDKYADNSVGNVTGSNSVNVFFGLGLPWLFGAVYWKAMGANDAWRERFGPGGDFELSADLYNKYKDTGAFIVPAGDLGLSVIVFTVCAIMTLGLILVRRQLGGQELGGNKMGAYASAGFLIVLWIIYLSTSIAKTYGYMG